MKEAYKELREKLHTNVSFKSSNNEYSMVGTVGDWVKQCGIKPTQEHTTIICNIFDGVPYPYNKADRDEILSYLKKYKYKDYSND